MLLVGQMLVREELFPSIFKTRMNFPMELDWLIKQFFHWFLNQLHVVKSTGITKVDTLSIVLSSVVLKGCFFQDQYMTIMFGSKQINTIITMTILLPYCFIQEASWSLSPSQRSVIQC
jgi:hypothetical protein